uniref:Uncharacterized protein n=1 Tax=Kalanchoe fedtschenkoi TaxID=63787 RepID=A0A7N0VM35_KALFE
MPMTPSPTNNSLLTKPITANSKKDQKCMSDLPDSNQRPKDYLSHILQSSALPTELSCIELRKQSEALKGTFGMLSIALIVLGICTIAFILSSTADSGYGSRVHSSGLAAFVQHFLT